MRRRLALAAVASLAVVGGVVAGTQEKCVARQEQTRPLGCARLLPDGGAEDVYPRAIRISEAVGNECVPVECAP